MDWNSIVGIILTLVGSGGIFWTFVLPKLRKANPDIADMIEQIIKQVEQSKTNPAPQPIVVDPKGDVVPVVVLSDRERAIAHVEGLFQYFSKVPSQQASDALQVVVKELFVLPTKG